MPSVTVFEVTFVSNIGWPAVRIGESDLNLYLAPLNALWAGLLLIGTLLGNLEGIRLPGHLREMNSTSEYLCEPGGHSGFKSEGGFNLIQTYLSGFLPFGPRG